MVVGAGDVFAAGVFVGHVVGHHGPAVAIAAAAGVPAVSTALGFGIAHGDGGLARAALVVDPASGGAADDGADRGPDHLSAAIADAAAQDRAGDAAEHAGHQATVSVAARLAIAIRAAAIVAATGVGIAAIRIAVAVAIRILGHVAVAADPAIAAVVDRLATIIEHRVHPQHARPVVGRLRIGPAPGARAVIDRAAVAVVAVGRRPVAAVIGLCQCGPRRQQQRREHERGGKTDPLEFHRHDSGAWTGRAHPS